MKQKNNISPKTRIVPKTKENTTIHKHSTPQKTRATHIQKNTENTERQNMHKNNTKYQQTHKQTTKKHNTQTNTTHKTAKQSHTNTRKQHKQKQ